jgi:hypothetical protein
MRPGASQASPSFGASTGHCDEPLEVEVVVAAVEVAVTDVAVTDVAVTDVAVDPPVPLELDDEAPPDPVEAGSTTTLPPQEAKRTKAGKRARMARILLSRLP